MDEELGHHDWLLLKMKNSEDWRGTGDPMWYRTSRLTRRNCSEEFGTWHWVRYSTYHSQVGSETDKKVKYGYYIKNTTKGLKDQCCKLGVGSDRTGISLAWKNPVRNYLSGFVTEIRPFDIINIYFCTLYAILNFNDTKKSPWKYIVH